MIKYIIRDEWFPFYDFMDDESCMAFPIDLPEEDYKKYSELMEQVYKWQDIFATQYMKSRGKL
jgi:hypothetical protein